MSRSSLLPPLLLILILGSAPRPSPAPSFRPPLEQLSGLVSSFGEYRPDHLHPGVDFSTSGRTGLPVHASAEGEIYRLKVEWRGYGRALYLRHLNGWISVYAHLESYEDRVLGLERRVEEERRRRAVRYPGDIFLEPPIKVKKGQLLGLSGESGAGLPHLHFEIRRDDQEPSDPLQSGWFQGEPSPAPTFESFLFRADAPQTWVDGERSREIPAVKRRDGTFAPARVAVVSGPFLPLARIHSADNAGHRLGLKALSVRLDGAPVYLLRLAGFRFSDYPKVGLLLDHAHSRMSPASFTYYLVRLPGNDLGPGGKERPFVVPASGSHELSIEVEGPLGRRSRAVVPFRVVRPPVLRWDPTGSSPDRPTLRFGVSRNALAPGWSVTYRAMGERGSLPCRDREERPDGESCRFDLPPAARGITAQFLQEGIPLASSTLFLPAENHGPPEEAPSFTVSPFRSFADLHLRVAGRARPPTHVRIRSGKGASVRELREEENGQLLATLPADVLSGAAGMDLEWEGAGDQQAFELPSIPQMAGASTPARLQAGEARLELAGDALYSPAPLYAETMESPPPPGEGLERVGLPVRFLPDGLPLAHKSVLSFPIPAGESHPERLGIYRLDPLGQVWTFAGGFPEGNALALVVGRLDTYGLLRDLSPPRIVRIRPSDPSSPVARPIFRVEVEERGEGLEYDGVHLLLDGVELEMEFDPDRGWSSGRPSGVLSPGTHTLQGWAVDRAGNRSADLNFTLTIR